jgi:hypothetical protein
MGSPAYAIDFDVEKSGETSGKPLPGSIVPQKHGGALRYGSLPGNTPGTGRPRNEVRELLLKGVDEEVIPKLYKHLASANEATSMAAADAFLRYGVGTFKEVSTEAVRAKVQATVDVIRAELAPEIAASIVEKLREVWR